MSRRRAYLIVLAFSLPLVAILAVGSATGHMAVAIFVVVGLWVLWQIGSTAVLIRRDRARAKRS